MTPTTIERILRLHTERYLDHGHYVVSEDHARRLNHGVLPRHGAEALVELEGVYCWLTTTTDRGLAVWTVTHAPDWKLERGKMVRPWTVAGWRMA